MKSNSTFEVLRKVDVSSYIEKKGKFNYLSWATAWDQLLSIYPDATMEVKRFNDLPYIMMLDKTCMVEVSVTINGIERSDIMPVIDGHKAVINPSSFQINTAIKRSLAKAIGMHGLGLYIYRGEDLPDVDTNLQEELRIILKKKNKYDEAAEAYLILLTNEQLNEAIARNKG